MKGDGKVERRDIKCRQIPDGVARDPDKYCHTPTLRHLSLHLSALKLPDLPSALRGVGPRPERHALTLALGHALVF